MARRPPVKRREHVRCRACRARGVLPKPLANYVEPPKCKQCGEPKLSRDKWMSERNTKAARCACDGYSFDHRVGSLHCKFKKHGVYKMAPIILSSLSLVLQPPLKPVVLNPGTIIVEPLDRQIVINELSLILTGFISPLVINSLAVVVGPGRRPILVISESAFPF